MTAHIKKQLVFFNFIIKADIKQQKALIKTLSEKQLDAICEISLNIYTGTFPVRVRYLNTLKPFASSIRLLSSREVTSNRKHVIISRHPKILFILIQPIIKYFDKLKRREKMAKELILIPKLKYEKLLKLMDCEIPINSNSEKFSCDQSFETKSQLDICNGSTKN